MNKYRRFNENRLHKLHRITEFLDLNLIKFCDSVGSWIGRYRSSTSFVAQVSEIEKIVQEVEKEKEEEAAAKKKDTKEK